MTRRTPAAQEPPPPTGTEAQTLPEQTAQPTPPAEPTELRNVNEKLLLSVLRQKEQADQLLAERDAILA